jgi:hypothetical protein
MYVLPKYGNYELRNEIQDVDDNGANTHRLIKVPKDKLQEWDATHDEAGALRRRYGSEGSLEGTVRDEKTAEV